MKRAVICLALLFWSIPALAGFHGGGIVNAWNGNLVQAAVEDYTPFIDFVLSGPNPETTNGALPDWRQVNIEGFPSTFTYTGSSSCEASGTIPWDYSAQLPTTLRSGTMQLQWTGCAYINLSNGATILPGQYGQNSCSGSCQACTYVDSTHLYGTNCWLQFSSTAVNAGGFKIDSVGDGTTDPQLTMVNIFYTADASAVATCISGRATGNITQLESCFTPQLITEFKKVGVIRFVDVMGENETTNSAQSTFEENTPLSFYRWDTLNRFVSSELATNTITNVSGAEYNLNFAGLTLSDRINFQAAAPSNIVAPSTTTTSSVAACTSSCVIPIVSTTNLVVGMIVGDATNNNLAGTAAITSVGSGQITVSCTNGSLPASACTTVNSTGLGSGDTLYFTPMLEINSSGTFFPMGTNSGGPITASSLSTVVSGNGSYFSNFTYLAGLNRFAVNSSSGNAHGVTTGWPLEVMVALANATGAHAYFNTPCFAMGNMTDWAQKEITFAKNNLLPGLLPFLEGTDEVWNPTYTCFYFANGEMNYFEGGGISGDNNKWYGWRISQVAQTVSSIFSNPSAANRLNYYRVIDGLSAFDGTPSGSGQAFTDTGQDSRLSYTGQGNDPAYKWVTDVAFASYYSPYMGSTTNAIAEAQSYAAAYAYSLSPSETYVHAYLDGVNTVASGTATLYSLHNKVYPDFSGFVGAYANDSTHGGPYPIRLAQYEGGENPSLPMNYNTNLLTIPVTATSTGPTTTFTTADNQFDYICNTWSLCPGTGSPTAALSGFTGTNCTLNGQDPVVLSATSTLITVAINSSSGDTGCSTGTIAYDNSATYWPAFLLVAANDAALVTCELASFDDFYAQAIAASVVPEFPSIYNWNSFSSFGIARYPGTIGSGNTVPTPGSTIPAVAAFQLSQSGPVTCNP